MSAKNNETVNATPADETVNEAVVPQQNTGNNGEKVTIAKEGDRFVIVVGDEDESKIKQLVNKIKTNKKAIVAFSAAAVFAGYAIKRYVTAGKPVDETPESEADTSV